MKAQTLTAIKAPLELQHRDDLEPGPGQVVVQLAAAALNRRDYWITLGMYPGIEPPVVLGSDGAGNVVRLGVDVDSKWSNAEVIINPGLDWGGDTRVQGNGFHILGLPMDGTLAEQVIVPASCLYRKPDHLSWQQAAALPLAGVTAHRALFYQGGLLPEQNLLITGIGGGVATFALQFAQATQANVWVTSSSPEKIERAMALGAKGGFLYTDEDWSKAARQVGGFDVILDSAAGKGYEALLGLAAPGGTIVNYGATTGPPEKLDLFKVFWKQLTLRGSTMGSPEDFVAMLELVNASRIAPIIDREFGLEEVNDAIGLMARSPQFGKFVVEIS